MKHCCLVFAIGLWTSPVLAQQSLPIPTVATGNMSQTIASASPGIFGCTAPGSKQAIGAGAGGVVGGLLGNRVAGGNRTLGTVVGGAVGAAAGSWIGCKLQINDQRKAHAALARAATESKPQQWSSADTGMSGTAIPLTSGQLSKLNFPQGILPVALYDDRGGAFTSSGRVNLRAGPSVDSAIVGTLNPGEPVDVVAGAKDMPWLLVAQGGTARGYVSEPLLVSTRASSAQGCRVIRQSIQSADKQTTTQDFTACPDGNGGWTLTSA